MAGNQDDDSTNEDRFGRQDAKKFSPWSSAVVVAVVAVIVGLVYFYFR